MGGDVPGGPLILGKFLSINDESETYLENLSTDFYASSDHQRGLLIVK